MEELLEYMREYLFEHQAEYEEWLKKREGERNEALNLEKDPVGECQPASGYGNGGHGGSVRNLH